MEVNLQDLEIGSVFHVKNGNWWGKIVSFEGSKALEFLPQGVCEKYLGERSVTTFAINEIKVNSLVRKAGPQKLSEKYIVNIDYMCRKDD